MQEQYEERIQKEKAMRDQKSLENSATTQMKKELNLNNEGKKDWDGYVK